MDVVYSVITVGNDANSNSRAKQGGSPLTYLHMYVYTSNCCHYKGADLSVTDVLSNPIDAVTEQRLSALRLQAMKDYSEDALPTK